MDLIEEDEKLSLPLARTDDEGMHFEISPTSQSFFFLYTFLLFSRLDLINAGHGRTLSVLSLLLEEDDVFKVDTVMICRYDVDDFGRDVIRIHCLKNAGVV